MFYNKSGLPLIQRRVVQKHDSFNKALKEIITTLAQMLIRDNYLFI
jgi:hypothetical protein